MNKKINKLGLDRQVVFAFLIAMSILLSTISVASVEAAAPNVVRYEGYSRDNVAENVAKAHFSNSNKVILVNREKFPDAISATNISQGRYPVLYTHSGHVTEGTIELMQSMPLDEIYVLGGTLSIGDSVITQLENATGVKVTRVAGRSRYDANVEAVKQSFGRENQVIIASGEVFSDALYGVSYANTVDAPIILTNTNRLEASTVQLLKNMGVNQATIIGGELTVTPAVEKQLKDLGISSKRIAGRNRYIGSAEVANASYSKPQNVVIASGEVFSDALVSAPLAQKLDAPILLVRSNRMESTVEDYLINNLSTLETIYVQGGPLTIKPSLLNPVLEHISENPTDSEEQERVTTREVQQVFAINHEIQYVIDHSLPEGEEVIAQEGVDGEGVRLYRQTLLNGKVLDEKVVSEEIRKDSIPAIIHVGVPEQSDRLNLDFDMELFNQEVLALVNEERTRLGISPLYYESELQHGADIRTLDSISVQTLLANHARPDGSSWTTAFEYLKNRPVYISGENLAYNGITRSRYRELSQTEGAVEAYFAELFYNQYADSQGHYENMISDYFNGMAVSTMFADHDNSSYFIRAYNTMVFSRK